MSSVQIVPDHLAAVCATAARVLEKRVGSAVTVVDPEDLGGSGRTDVVRARVVDQSGLPRTVVIKQLRGSSDRGEGVAAFAREGAAYKLATALSLASRPGPALIASDLDERILVLEDLGVGESLTEALLTADPDQARSEETLLAAWGQALGRMHAATADREADFHALARREHTDGLADPVGSVVAAAVADIDEVTAALGLPAPPPVLSESLAHGVALFGRTGRRAFSPSDVGPDNILVTHAGVKFLDYEWAGFRDIALDIGYALATYPRALASGRATVALDRALASAWSSEVRANGEGLRVSRENVVHARVVWVFTSTSFLRASTGRDAMVAKHLDSLWADRAAVAATWLDLAAYPEENEEFAAYARAVAAALNQPA